MIRKEGRLTVAVQASTVALAQLDKLGVDVQQDLAISNGELSIILVRFSFFIFHFSFFIFHFSFFIFYLFIYLISAGISFVPY